MAANKWVLCAGGCGKRTWRIEGHSAQEPICHDCRKARRNRVCAVCETPFVAPTSNSGKKTCSRECTNKLNGTAVDLTERICNGCGKLFTPYRSDLKVCSRICSGKVRQGWLNGQPPERLARVPGLPSHLVEIPLQKCLECSEFFLARTDSHKICSETCRKRRNVKQILTRYYSDPEFRDRTVSAAEARRADKLGVNELKTRIALIAYLMERDNQTCQLCQGIVEDHLYERYDPKQPSADHIIPLSRGGTHSLDNLQLAHLGCNWSKGNRESVSASYALS